VKSFVAIFKQLVPISLCCYAHSTGGNNHQNSEEKTFPTFPHVFHIHLNYISRLYRIYAKSCSLEEEELWGAYSDYWVSVELVRG